MSSSEQSLWYGNGSGRDYAPVPAAGSTLADVLERVLDKGIVIAGDVAISLLDIELLTIKLRLLIASADKAKELGIDWWTRDGYLSGEKRTHDGQRELEERVRELESTLRSLGGGEPAGRSADRADQPVEADGSRG